ncbi:MAG TPA: hypothetical protein VFH92_12335, partial [Phenylobacterium sp.]|nr:hypothetical protein [Phenylobacterium sp.]
ADAAALPGPEPSALPSLRELLAQVTAQAPPARSTASAAPSQSQAGGLRGRLTGSAGLATLAPPLDLRIGPSARRATGPPRR